MDCVIPDLVRNPGFPVETGTQFFIIDPCFRRDDVWIPAGVYPDGNRGENDSSQIIVKPLLRHHPRKGRE